MGCGCGKKKGPGIIRGGYKEDSEASGEPEEWGPSLWFVLHLYANRIGIIPELIEDYRLIMDMLINWLPNILPCNTCQEHCKQYLGSHPIDYWKTITNMNDLKNEIQVWLMNFHNDVRLRKSQPILISSIGQLQDEYNDKTLEECKIKIITDNVLFGIRTGKVKMDNWKRWLKQFNKLKIMLNL